MADCERLGPSFTFRLLDRPIEIGKGGQTSHPLRRRKGEQYNNRCIGINLYMNLVMANRFIRNNSNTLIF